jgi:hypothetical protein
VSRACILHDTSRELERLVGHVERAADVLCDASTKAAHPAQTD